MSNVIRTLEIEEIERGIFVQYGKIRLYHVAFFSLDEAGVALRRIIIKDYDVLDDFLEAVEVALDQTHQTAAQRLKIIDGAFKMAKHRLAEGE